MIIDFHTHIFPPQIIASRDTFRARDPTFAALYGRPTARLATANELLQSMDKAGIDISVILGFAWRDPELCHLHNDYLQESAARSNGRLIPFPIIQPGDMDRARQELASWGPLVRGIGELRPEDQGYDLDGPAGALLAEAAHSGLLPLFHVSEPVGHSYPGKEGLALGAFYRFLTSHPKVQVVGAHWAGGLPFFAVMPEVQTVLQRVYMDTAGTSLLYRPVVYRWVIELVGPEHILFGSDFPLLSQRRQLRLLNEAPIDDRAKALIRGENAARLLGLSKWDSENDHAAA